MIAADSTLEGDAAMTGKSTIGVVGTGDMGSAVGAALVRAGYRVVTAGEGRSDASRRLAAAAGIEDLRTLEAVVRSVDLLLSIVPPAAAASFAAAAAYALRATGARPVFADCNAVAPDSVRAIAREIAPTGAPFVDAGIVGREPRHGERTRLYVSGPARAALTALTVAELEIVDLGDEIGAASALKMAYSALNKGTDALLAGVLLAAERLGVRAPLMRELEFSQAQLLARMRARVPFLGATAWRFAPEMAEIARTYDSVGVTPLFHRGAEWLYALVATTSFAQETRATQPRERSLDETVAVLTAALDRQRCS
jgi:3-hydroxyisobutyrate dehydrogenase-like beta-hydroxyacid dehydrogenase